MPPKKRTSDPLPVPLTAGSLRKKSRSGSHWVEADTRALQIVIQAAYDLDSIRSNADPKHGYDINTITSLLRNSHEDKYKARCPPRLMSQLEDEFDFDMSEFQGKSDWEIEKSVRGRRSSTVQLIHDMARFDRGVIASGRKRVCERGPESMLHNFMRSVLHVVDDYNWDPRVRCDGRDSGSEDEEEPPVRQACLQLEKDPWSRKAYLDEDTDADFASDSEKRWIHAKDDGGVVVYLRSTDNKRMDHLHDLPPVISLEAKAKPPRTPDAHAPQIAAELIGVILGRLDYLIKSQRGTNWCPKHTRCSRLRCSLRQAPAHTRTAYAIFIGGTFVSRWRIHCSPEYLDWLLCGADPGKWQTGKGWGPKLEYDVPLNLQDNIDRRLAAMMIACTPNEVESLWAPRGKEWEYEFSGLAEQKTAKLGAKEETLKDKERSEGLKKSWRNAPRYPARTLRAASKNATVTSFERPKPEANRNWLAGPGRRLPKPKK